LTTGTASGKSLVFYAASIELFSRQPGSKVIAIFPLKALAREQQQRWQAALNLSGLQAVVERLDGDVPMQQRWEVLANADVLVATPDIVHAWLLGSINDDATARFLSKVQMVVLDEVHIYTGIFGSNMAFLLRRLAHAVSILGGDIQYLAASATIVDAMHHLEVLTGRTFVEVGPDRDTSLRYELKVHMVNPPEGEYTRQSIVDLMQFILRKPRRRFITFVDSRKQAELLAAALYDADSTATREYDGLAQNPRVMPYRSGYEEKDRTAIEEALRAGTLSGVISTSALELGIDIGALNTGILVGVPRSSTSLNQRIGRIARQGKGDIIIINAGDFHSRMIFENPDMLFEMPAAEGALFLENKRVQYIHAMCLARQGGEDDAARRQAKQALDPQGESLGDWPRGFVELCQDERSGSIPTALQGMKMAAGDDPNHAFPLRDCDTSLRVGFPTKTDREWHGRTYTDDTMIELGNITLSQALREAYPGAVYMHMAHPYRVVHVDLLGHRIVVRPTSGYQSTSPIEMPPLLFPSLTADGVFQVCQAGRVPCIECDVQVRESVRGVVTHYRYRNESMEYPLTGQNGVIYHSNYFSRNYDTTGVLLIIQDSVADRADLDLVARLLLESFLSIVPFEHRDVNASSGTLRRANPYAPQGSPFLCVYDATFGSLHLSSRLLEPEVLHKVGMLLSQTDSQSLSEDSSEVLDDATVRIACLLGGELCQKQLPMSIQLPAEPDQSSTPDRYVSIILPGSCGLSPSLNEERFIVSGVRFVPSVNCLCYTGHHESEVNVAEDTTIYMPVSRVEQIPGISKMGFYDLESGAVLTHIKERKR
jgi:DEAD/DEAH box helicase domain-containing protein